MEVAFDKNNNFIYASDAIKGNEYFCPYCHENLILRKGKIVSPHYAHKVDSDCVETGEMCEWHIRMQSYFSSEYREVVVEKDGKKHRADILKDNIVIEFQHSAISLDDFNERNNFYISLGYKVIWIFDSTEWWDSGKLSDSDYDNLFNLKRPLKILQHGLISSKVSICFCDYTDGIDYVYNVYWHNYDWSLLGMDKLHNSIELSDDLNLEFLFYSTFDWKDYYLRNTKVRRVYRRFTGHRKEEYMCPVSDTWARNCDICNCCKLYTYNEKGAISYCEYERIKGNGIKPNLNGKPKFLYINKLS